ncbi:zinc-finger-containing protein [Achromobacter xylosoxidans]
MHRVMCPYCDRQAALVTGRTIYPRREDLFPLSFWHCEACDAYVGCHKKGAWTNEGGKRVISDGSLPLGRLANATLRRLKQAAHAEFDPLWRSGEMTRLEAYTWLAKELGISASNCHIGMMDEDTCKAVVAVMRCSRAAVAQV